MMLNVLLIYGTTDGHTKKVANEVARFARNEGCSIDVVDSATGLRQDIGRYDAVWVAASVHASGYQRSVKRWVRAHAAALRNKPGVFISVCLGVLQDDADVRQDLERILERFFSETGWNPQSRQIVAGAIPYTRYGFLKKWVMKRIAAKAGGGTDTTQDYEYTDWKALEVFVREAVRKLGPAEPPVQEERMKGMSL